MPAYKHPKEKNLSPHFASPYIFPHFLFPLSEVPDFFFCPPSFATHKKSFEFLKRPSRLVGLEAWRPISTTAASNPNLACFFCWESGISQRLSAAATKKGRKGRISAIRPHTPSFFSLLFKLEIRQKADFLFAKWQDSKWQMSILLVQDLPATIVAFESRWYCWCFGLGFYAIFQVQQAKLSQEYFPQMSKHETF